MFNCGDKIRFKTDALKTEYTFLAYIPEENRRRPSQWEPVRDCVLITKEGYVHSATEVQLELVPVPPARFETGKRYRSLHGHHPVVRVYFANDKYAIGFINDGEPTERPWSREQSVSLLKQYEELGYTEGES